jgi:integrase
VGDVIAVTDAAATSLERPDTSVVIARLRVKALEYAADALAESTWRVYKTDWVLFTKWCREHGRPVFPDGQDAAAIFIETITLYVTWLAELGRKPSTIEKKLSSISVAYGTAGVLAHKQLVWAQPVRSVVHGLKRRRALDGEVTSKKKALRIAGLKKLSDSLGGRPVDVRDRAILLIMFAGAFRRSEIEGLELRDFTIVDEGLEIHLRRSKKDQTGKGLTKGIPFGSNLATCPVRAWQAWLRLYGRSEGPAFPAMNRYGDIKDGPNGPRAINGRAVAEMIQRRAAAAKLDGKPEDWGGHSPRRGFATEAYANDAQEREIMKQGGWTSTAVMRGYAEDGGVWKHNAAMKLGL